MNDDAQIAQEMVSIQDPPVTTLPTVSGVDSSGDLHEPIVVDAASSMELDLANKNDARVSESEKSEKDGPIGSEENDVGEKKSEDILADKDDDSSQLKEAEEEEEEEEDDEDVSDDQSSELGSEADEKKLDLDLKEEKRGVSDYKSLLSEFDDYVASEKMGSGVSRALSYGFQVGDLVWGKVKSHPWWPGQIFNEAFASPSVRRMRRIDHVLVAFFGDSSYGWFDPAELIPFEPNLVEKSQQTVSKHFVRAVEEAIDEACKRSALGVTCKCRNPYNFRPTNVEDYFSVDVPDYELQAVYSAEQIKDSRDKFVPLEFLSFVKHLALAPHEYDSESIKFMKKKAMVFGIRKAVFEEFDETYSEAFGTKSVRSSVSKHEPHSKAPPRAPLSGPLVMAETLGDRKSSKKPTKVKDSKKQGKNLLKQRNEAGDMSVQFGKVEASSAASHIQGLDGPLDGDFVLQKRVPTLQTPMKDEQSGIVGMDVASSGSQLSLDKEKGLAEDLKEKTEERAAVLPEHGKSEAMTSLKEEARTDLEPAGSSLQPLEGKSSTVSVIKKVKVAKRASSEMGLVNPSQPKKKKKQELDSNHPEKRKFLSSGEAGVKQSSQLGSAHLQFYMNVDVPQVLSHLKDLSLDPFHGSSVASFGAAKKFFLRFRSLNYQKSSSVSSRDTKPVQTVKRTEDPSKAGKKRLSSDHPDEIPSPKKLKKTNLLKQMASEKKISREGKDSIKPVRQQSNAVQAKQVRAQTGKKQAPSVKVVEPTMLVMKFPPGTSLPSAALLKARFGRFGMLDQSAIRVFWKSSTCRVVFLYKADAENACRYATGNNSLFGNVSVKYFLRDVDAPKAEPREPENTKEDDEPQSQWVDQATPPLHQPILPPPNVNLKSCLKKPVDDNGNGTRGNVRVKFMLGGEEAATEPQPPVPTILNRNSGPSSSSSSSVPMEFVSKKFQNVASTLPPLLPLPPQYAKPPQLPIKPVDHVEPPSRNIRGPTPAVSPGDISHQMLNLLSKCNDVVANVTSLLGYVPYHPL